MKLTLAVNVLVVEQACWRVKVGRLRVSGDLPVKKNGARPACELPRWQSRGVESERKEQTGFEQHRW